MADLRRPVPWRVWLRAILGPVALFVGAEVAGVRVTGPVTVALTVPRPPVTGIASDVLVALALTTLALYGAGALAGVRVPLGRFLAPVASAQLPMALVALLAGRGVLARVLVEALRGHGEKLLKQPSAVMWPLLPGFAAALLLTALAVGLLYVGYVRATGLRGGRLALSFAAGLIAAEVLCRLWMRFAG